MATLKEGPTASDYYNSLIERINSSRKTISEGKEKAKNKRSELSKGIKSKGFFDRLQDNIEISVSKLSDGKYDERDDLLKKLISKIKEVNAISPYKIDSLSSESLESVSRFLSEEEKKELLSIVQECIGKAKRENVERSNQAVEAAKSLRKKSEIYNKISVSASETGSLYEMTVDMAIDRFGYSKMKTRESKYDKEWDPFVIVHTKREKSEGQLKAKIDKAMSDPEFKKTHEYTVIKRNYDKIMKAVSDARNAMVEAENISADLKGLDGRVFGEVRDYLRSLSEQRKEDYRKANELLDKINLPKVEAVADQIIEKEREERLKAEKEESLKSKYAKAVEELERMKYNGGSANEIQALKRDIANMEMSDTDLFETKMNALSKVSGEQQDKEDKRHEDEDKKEKENRLKKALNDLDEAAEDILEYRNRNLWKFNQDSKERKEEKRKIMGQIAQEAKLDPKERTLYQLKVDGTVRQEATLETLTPREANAFRQLYQYNQANPRQYYDSIRAYQEMTDGSLEDDISMHI